VLASEDAGTPFALEGKSTAEALAAFEFREVLERVAAHAAGASGAASVRARRPADQAAVVAEELAAVGEVLALWREGRGPVAEEVPDIGASLAKLRIAGSVLEGIELARLGRLLVAARVVAGEIRRITAEAPRAGRLLVALPDPAIERRLALSIDADGQLLDSASPALVSARSEVRTTRDRLVRRLESMLRNVEGAGEGGVTVRNGRYVIPVPRDSRSRPVGIVHDESASGSTLFVEPSQVIELGNALRAAEAREDREALKVLRDLTELLRPQLDSLDAAHGMCVAFDDLVARARYALASDGNLPAVRSAPAPMTIVNARHPLLLAGAITVVPFDLSLGDAERTVLLSGPNTGGKTVMLKAIGLCCALAQSGIIPPVGPGSVLPVFRQFFADIGDRQSIAQSLSTFSGHVATLRRILDEAGDDSLVLLDEVGSGTDPAEGAALAWATLESLTRRGAVTIATTHLGALKQLSGRCPGVVNASLQFDAATLRPTYRLLMGVPGRSYGLAIARRLGIPDEVLHAAEGLVPEAERSLDAILAAVEERERQLAAREAVVESQALETEGLAARLEAQRQGQNVRETALRAREKAAEREAREQAKAYLLEARRRVEEAIGMARAAVDEVTAREARRLVEEGIQAERRALDEAGREEAELGAAASSGLPAVGARVRLSGGMTGRIMDIRADGKLVVVAGAMRMVVPAESVAVLAGGAGERAAARSADSYTAPVSTASAAPLEIDLRGLTGDEAEAAVNAAIDAAILAENPYLRIIHGKGTGALRERVRQITTGDRRVARSSLAPANQGGSGVTIVEFAP